MPVSQKVTPLNGCDFDVDETSIEELKAFFLKNITSREGRNPNAAIGQGQKKYAFTPLESNSKYCNIPLPAGDNFCVGFKYFKEINRGFVCVWNSNDDHLVYQINAGTGACQLLKKTSCFNFQLSPEYFIAESRMAIQTTCRHNKITDLQENVIFLVIVDDYNPQRMLCVDDLIATSGFDKTLFPYFNVNDNECDECININLGIAGNKDCIVVTPVPRNLTDPAELLKPNKLNFKAWEFRVMGIDVWGRPTGHGPISTKYINAIGGTCIQESNGLSRCLKLTFPAGCAIIDKWQIEFRNCNKNIRGLSVESDWFLHDTIDKYNNCDNKNWWEREKNTTADNFTFNAVNNTIEYIFCADKECQPLPVKETNKTSDFLPITSGTVVPLGKNIALAKNTRGFEPLDCKELEKMNFTIQRPVAAASCLNSELRKITIWGIIWNPYEDDGVDIRKKDDNIVFGVADCQNNNPITFEQVLPKNQEGIIGYLAGTSHYNVSKQYNYDRITADKTFVGLDYKRGNPLIGIRNFPLQKWEFNVLPGKYVFRISSHKSSPSDDFKSTSTYTIGRTSLNSLGGLTQETKEIVINVCDNDVEILNEPIMIWDLTRIGKGCTVVDVSSVNNGYLYEDEVNKIPVEMASVDCSPGGGTYQSHFTDHNGFYFATNRARGLQTTLRGKKNCVNNTEIGKSRKSFDNRDAWYRFDKIYVYKKTDLYLTKDRVKIKGKIVLCDNPNIGVAGALVVLTRGGFATTNSQGEFTIIAHDIGNAGVRIDNLIYSQRGTCQLLQCGVECVNCFADAVVNLGTCSGSDRIVTAPTLQVRINGFNKKGPHMGGRYGISLFEHDWLDRVGYGQMLDKHYLNIPSLQDTQVYDYCKILFDITGMTFKKGTKRISFGITDNLNEDDYLTWPAERVQFIDNSGKPNTAAPTKIRLYYEGLNEYNKQNDYSTNAVWDFIANKEDGSTISGDEVEFLANGDGTIFTTKITQLVTYDKIGKYIQVAYREDLKDLKDGALIRLIRQKQCEQKEFFYELCPIIKVVNQQATVLTGEIEFFDSYLLNRQIPVPVTVVTKKKDADNNEIETSVTENELKNFPFLFEHHSPSDFWGDHCSTKGRVNAKNPFENQQCRKDEICMSRALTDDGLLNGLHRYAEEDAVRIGEKFGGITSALAELNVVLIICENATLTVPFNDTNVKADAEGRIFAPSLDDKFGNPQKKTDFGCQPWDINTIRIKNGIIMFIDSKNSALVKHDFTTGYDISLLGAKGLVSSYIKYMIRNNYGDGKKMYAHGVIDPKTGEYLLTFAILRGSSSDYINDSSVLEIGKNETAVWDLYDDKNPFRGTRSYTPEYYGWLDGDRNDQQLLAFKFGEAWMHHNLANPSAVFNNFFGTQCTPVFELVFNLQNDKVKNYMSLNTYCKEVLFYADRIITESGQQSRLMPRWWDKRDKFFVGDFKCATNTQPDSNLPKETGENALLDGDSLIGRWIKVRFRPKIADRGKYFELTSVICFMNGAEKSGEG